MSKSKNLLSLIDEGKVETLDYKGHKIHIYKNKSDVSDHEGYQYEVPKAGIKKSDLLHKSKSDAIARAKKEIDKGE